MLDLTERFRPLCLPDDDDLALDLPAERTGTAVGWGLTSVSHEDIGCDYIRGNPNVDSSPTKLKKIKLK